MKTFITPRIPIFITVRGNNDEAFTCNKEAMKYTYILIKDMNLFEQTFIISDNENMLNYAKELGFINIIYQECKTENDVNYLDYIGIYNFYRKTGYKPDWMILLSVGQLFKNKSLLYDCIRNIDDSYDVVASYTEISNKSAFFIKNDKIVSYGHLVSHERDRQKMIDSAIYAIKTDFAIKCMETKDLDPSAVFWEGNIKYFENSSIYTDIVNINDIKKYEYVGDIITEVKSMNGD
jgi:CMP-N-acetylneuraminic acid synthetase